MEDAYPTDGPVKNDDPAETENTETDSESNSNPPTVIEPEPTPEMPALYHRPVKAQQA